MFITKQYFLLYETTQIYYTCKFKTKINRTKFKDLNGIQSKNKFRLEQKIIYTERLTPRKMRNSLKVNVYYANYADVTNARFHKHITEPELPHILIIINEFAANYSEFRLRRF